MSLEHTAFVPNGDSRKNTAVLLVGTADEFGIAQRSIKAVQGGFRITEELADVLYDESTSIEQPEPSGQGAEQENSKEESL